ncbi:MAG TPA: glucose-1-phosphate adenylyltransferase [Planctomycetaceae bacterium]|nr:glucose-1-phosphate adenylyltransferase [Planctomycetaceae bacterium]
MLSKTLTIILAGGAGSRLHPLTIDRAKPAVPFAGKYRIVDFTLSNCLHSGMRRVLVLTQYKSQSLQKHLRDGWSIFNPEIQEYITVVPPQMRTGDSWYSGTANAIYQNLYLLERSGAEHVLILSGDHIYRMDYAAMVKFHVKAGAAATIACMDVPVEEANEFGVMAVNDRHEIVEFQEKPISPKTLPGHPDRSLVSMGIYVFSMDILRRELERDHDDADSSHDFGKNILPRLIDERRAVFEYRFGGKAGRVTQDRYWKDVGTLDAYYQANMDLLLPIPPLDLYQADWPIRTYHGQNPPARMVPGRTGAQGELSNSILGAGTIISGGKVRHSILSARVVVEEDAEVDNSILLDGVRVGPGAKVQRCIIDKGAYVPPGETVGYDREADLLRKLTVSEQGVVVVPKGYRFA